MPIPINLQLPLHVPREAQKAVQARFSTLPLGKDHPFCVCCPQGILAVSRHLAGRKCDEVTWQCPFATSRKAPVE